MPTPNLEDVINGATPLEYSLAEVHPRLFLNARRLEVLRGRQTREPWATMLRKTRKHAEDAIPQVAALKPGDRTPGGNLPHLALTYLTTGEKKYLDTARDLMRATCQFPGPDGHGHFGGFWLYAMGIAYDWLYHDLDAQTLAETRSFIDRHGRGYYESLGKYETVMAGWYTGNHLPNYLYDLSVGGMAIYNDVPNMGPWIRLVMEKARQMILALGPDGASPEGICYAGGYTEPLVSTVDLVNDLLGVDLFAQSPWLANNWAFHVYSSLPRAYWRNQNYLMCFGDGVTWNWIGPDTYLFRMAAYHGNGHAQWMALETMEAGAASPEGPCLDPIRYDPTIPAIPPTDLPTYRHFEDHGLVFIRSGWDGHESLFGFRCAPFCGHFAMARYNTDIAGGHMHPEAGSFQLFAHGDWLIIDPGYVQKLTAYRNTIVVNGIGQTGEKSEWFEGVELRRERRGPKILRVEAGDKANGTDQVVVISADLTQAYEHAAKVKRILRHVVSLGPDCWVILDEVDAQEPSTFEVFFHAARPFEAVGADGYRTCGDHGSLKLTTLAPQTPAGLAVFLEKQIAKGIGAYHVDRTTDILRLVNPAPQTSSLFVTMLETYPTNQGPTAQAAIGKSADGGTAVTVNMPGRQYRIDLPADGGPIRVMAE